MANFLSGENEGDSAHDPTQPKRTPRGFVHQAYVDPASSIRAHEDYLKYRRSILRMKILTAISVAVIVTLAIQRYAHSILNHNDRPRSSQAIVAPPHFESASSDLPVQNAPLNSNRGLFDPKNLNTASKEELMSAIQEPILDADLVRTSSRAKAGDMSADYAMGLRFAHGDGVPQDYSAAMKWFEKAAQRGDAEAQLKLVFGYIQGIGLPRDEHQSVMWLKRAANNGNTWAQRALSNLYLTGENVPKDYVRAYTWAIIASESDGKHAEGMTVFESRMSRVQIADAERRISVWNHAHPHSMNQPAKNHAE
jgi:hypothetical protein